jgi:RimJ/RimL family protein N-acetyltransferase
MRHSLHIEGYGFHLRPVELTDAAFIAQMRTADPSRVRYLHPVPPGVETQRAWLAAYFDREGDYYWVIERRATRQPEGLIGIYDVNRVAGSAEWGRWILSPGSLGAVESALLVYRAAFTRIKLDSLYCLTVVDNKQVLSFHDSCGLQRMEVLKGKYALAGGVYDAVKHQCSKSGYSALVQRLEPRAKMIAQRLCRPP